MADDTIGRCRVVVWGGGVESRFCPAGVGFSEPGGHACGEAGSAEGGVLGAEVGGFDLWGFRKSLKCRL